jgi:hypothetical protein
MDNAKEQQMELNTRQVRAIALKATDKPFHTWTDKTSNYDDARRSVVWSFYGAGGTSKAQALFDLLQAEFARLGVTNKLTLTGTTYEYVRVIAPLGNLPALRWQDLPEVHPT